MRITQGMYYQNFNSSNSALANELLNVNRQISSGAKIQYAYQDPNAFAKTLNLNDEISTFSQIISSVNSAQNISKQTDSTISGMISSLTQFKTTLIQAASGGQSGASMDAIAQTLSGIKTHLMNLANTSVNGQYLFSGSATSQKPINANGQYMGNTQQLTAFLGSGVKQAYNIPGSQLFLGSNSSVKRTITTNVPHLNQTLLHPSVMTTSPDQNSQQVYITPTDTIRDLVGSSSSIINSTLANHNFYIQGTTHDGTTFNTTISLTDTNTVQDLMNKIGEAFGNTPTNNVVDVSLNAHGEFVIKDNLPGSSKLDFHMVENTSNTPQSNLTALNSDKTNLVSFNQSSVVSYISKVGQQHSLYDPASYTLNMQMTTHAGQTAQTSTPLLSILPANTATILFSGNKTDGSGASSTFTVTSSSTVQDLMNAIKTTYQSAGDDLNVGLINGKLTFYTKAGAGRIDISMISQDSSGTTINGLTANAGLSYDTAAFTTNGASLTSNVSQIVNADNSYATNSTTLSQVSGISPFVSSTQSRQLILKGIDINGKAFNATIDLKQSGSTFSVDGGTTNYPIYSMATPRIATNGNDVTYQQLSDVVNMIVSNNLPLSTSSPTAYDTAIANADIQSTVKLNDQGQLTFTQNNANITKAQISLYDANSNSTASSSPAALEFNANKANTVSDPKTNFFSALSEAISSVSKNQIYPDSTLGSQTSIGIENSITMITNLINHVTKVHSLSGVQTQSLQQAADTTSMLKVSTQIVQSSVIDTNIAEATARLSQLQLNQQALYASLSKVSKLSLVNYI